MRKRERLLNLLCLMWSSKRKFTRDEIFRRMAPYRSYANSETARRTFERDKAALRQVGFDIRTDQPEDGPATYTLAQPNDSLGEMDLSDSERVALAVSLAMVNLGGAHSVDRTLIKLGASPEGMAAMNWIWVFWRRRRCMICWGRCNPGHRCSSTTRAVVDRVLNRFGS